jgi:glycosyltransferase involved in cell wall biosynthesis
MRILIVSQMTPYLPCHDGFRVLAAHLLQNLARHHRVALIAAATPAETPEQQRWPIPFCAWTETVPLARWSHPLTGAPDEGVARLRAAVLRALERFAPDVIHLEGGVLAPLARVNGVPTVLSIHDSRALRAREFRRLARTPWAWLRAGLLERREAAWEHRWFGAADACVVLSEEDRTALAGLGLSARTQVIPTGIDLRQYEFRRAGQPGRIVFTGNLAWPPNVDAARRFATVIFPKVRAAVPRAEFVVAGADPVPAVRALGALPGVRVTGTVPDLRPSIWGAGVYVSPLRAGFGMKNKILEAMALGTPIVASPRSLSGLRDVAAGRHLLVADSDDATAQAVLTLLSDGTTADTLACNARALVERCYSWPTVARRYEALLGQVAGAEAAEAMA